MLLMLLACVGKSDDSAPADTNPDACGGIGAVHTCVFLNAQSTDGVVDAPVYLAPTNNDDPVEGVTGADGCLTVDVDAGDWRVYATSIDGDCSSNTTAITVTACATQEITAYLEDRCVEG